MPEDAPSSLHPRSTERSVPDSRAGAAADIGLFGKGDEEISTGVAARLLGCSDTSVHRKIEDGTLRAYQPAPGARYRVSRLSVLQILNSIGQQIAEASPVGRRDSDDF